MIQTGLIDPTIDTRQKRGLRKALDRAMARLIDDAYAEKARREAAQSAPKKDTP